jgi:hypothetical protein
LFGLRDLTGVLFSVSFKECFLNVAQYTKLRFVRTVALAECRTVTFFFYLIYGQMHFVLLFKNTLKQLYFIIHVISFHGLV